MRESKTFLIWQVTFLIMPMASAGPAPSFRKVMVFVDGGYLRAGLRTKFQNDEISIDGFRDFVYDLVNRISVRRTVGELIRTYFYDSIVDENEKEKREEQKQFFSSLRQVPSCTVRLGRLVKTKQGYRQKGVDILMAIDMLTKAYENHYEIAILIAGDGDFADLVEAVKNTGKRVYGAYIQDHVSDKLLESFDLRISLSDDMLKRIIS